MAMAGERHAYPLVASYAHRFRGMRSALIGDTAVGMHPVTAHGYNLGLQGVDTLAGLVLQAHRAGADIGAAPVLAAYEATHRRHTKLIYHGTNAVAKLYADNRAPLRLLRHLVLQGAQRCPPLKAAITRQLTGHRPTESEKTPAYQAVHLRRAGRRGHRALDEAHAARAVLHARIVGVQRVGRCAGEPRADVRRHAAHRRWRRPR